MAREYTLVCDSCGKKQSARVQILSCSGRREDGIKVDAELCTSCWDRMVKEYHLTTSEKKARRDFEVINYEDIPRT